MKREEFLQFLDLGALSLPKKSFQSEREQDSDKKRHWELYRMKLSANLPLLKQQKVSVYPSNDKVLKIYEAIVYKYGQAYRHHNFYRSAKQLMSFLNRLKDGSFLKNLERLFKGLNESDCEYLPTNDFIIFTGALLCRRIVLLDRLRMLAARNVDFALGYVELGHLVKFNMLLISLAAELAENAVKHMQVLVKFYNEIAGCFCLVSEKFPLSCDCMQLESVKIDSSGHVFVSEMIFDNIRCLKEVMTHTKEPNTDTSMNDIKTKIEKEMILLTKEDEQDAQKAEEETGFYKFINKPQRRKRRRDKK